MNLTPLLSLLCIGGLLSTQAEARTLPAIFPSPQSVTLGGELITITQLQYIEAEVPEEAYVIEMNENGLLTISSSSEKGKFYALQSLSQLLGHTQAHQPEQNFKIIGEQLPKGCVSDIPDIAYRGVVEGFYGDLWSHEARMAQLQFYGRNKLNTYIYGPKDDPYHSRQWREPYPSAQAAQLGELATLAKQVHVNFYWAIHPGASIQWNEQDMQKVITKLEQMYELGVRHFAVFFDDISGEGTRAEKQAELMNKIQKEFVDAKGDVGELLICPTQYNRAWAHGDYLPTLGKLLDPRIHIMWTGDTVVHDITLSGQEWVKAQINRPSFVWWNSPCTDFARNHLSLGRVYGLEGNDQMKEAISGFTSNPMDKPEASKIALFGVADYCWNISEFHSDYTWKAGITRQFGEELAIPMTVFASHNSSLGENCHNFDREESVQVQKDMQQLMSSLADNRLDEASKKKVSLAYAYLSKSCELLLQSQLPAIDEMRPWIRYGAEQGKTGQSILFTLMPEANGAPSSDYESLLPPFMKAIKHRIAQERISNQYPTGITVGSAIMQPCIEQLIARFDQNYMQQLMQKNTKGIPAAKQPQGKSGMNGFEHIACISNKDLVGLNPIQEVHALPAGSSIELQLPALPEASVALIDVGDAQAGDWADVVALDRKGKEHPLTLAEVRGTCLLYVLPANKGLAMPCAGLILRNTSKELQGVQLKQFGINARSKASYEDINSLQDGKLSSAYAITPDMVDKDIIIPRPKGSKEVLIIADLPCKLGGMEMKLSEEVNLGRHTLPSSLKTITLTPHQSGNICEIIFR